jgi:hypothetical protein
VLKGIRKRVNRQNCQEVCRFNERFARPTAERGYAARGPGELPHGVEALPGERAVEGGVPRKRPKTFQLKRRALIRCIRALLRRRWWSSYAVGG